MKRQSLTNTQVLSLLITLAISVSSCNGLAEQSQNNNATKDTLVTVDSAYTDPLFFIEGQLCQHLRKIYQDSKGNLWMGTNVYGLMLYDGSKLTYLKGTEGLGGGRITGIVEDDEGNIWFGSYRGLTKYDGKKFTNYTVADGLLNNEVWSLCLDSKGKLWVGNNAGVSVYDGDTFTTFNVPKASVSDSNTIYSYDRIVAIVEDKDGAIWLGTDGFGVCKYYSGVFTHYTAANGLADNTIGELMVDSKNNLWIGTYYGGVSRYDGKTFNNFTRDSLITGEEVGAFYEDTNGDIWFAAENNGVYKYDGKSFYNYGEEEGMIGGILCIYRDNQKRFWFGGWGGLFRYDGKDFKSVTKDGPW